MALVVAAFVDVVVWLLANVARKRSLPSVCSGVVSFCFSIPQYSITVQSTLEYYNLSFSATS
eukprot:4066262-Amphidinium_carterae.1